MLKKYFTNKKKDFIQYVLTVAIIAIIFTPLYLLFPFLEAAFTNEGMFMEMLAVFLYAYCILKAGEISLLTKKVYTRGIGIFLSLFSLLWLLEETSFGHNIIYRYDRPILYGTKVDTIHDLLRVLEHLLLTQPTSLVTIITLGCIGLAAAAIVWICVKYKTITKKFLSSSSALFLIITIALLVVGGLIDLDPLKINKGARFFVFCEEFLELAAAISMVFAVRVFYKEHFKVTEKE